MRYTNTFIAAAGVSLGATVAVQDAVNQGQYAPDLAEDDGYQSVSVSQGKAAVELATSAARKALHGAGLGNSLDLVLHSCVGYQGHDDFATAAYLHRQVASGNGVPMEVNQASNGGMAALDVAARYLAGIDSPATALLATSDVFELPMTARYGTPGTLYGDAGTAVVLTNQPAWLQVLSIDSAADTTHEPMQRAGLRWSSRPGELGWPLDVAGRVASYVDSHGPEAMLDLVRRIQATEKLTIERALQQADMKADAIDHWVYPNMGLTLTDWGFREAYGSNPARSTWEWGRTVGHLGAGDQFAALDHLASRLLPGEHIMLHGAGTGFTFSSAVLKVTASRVVGTS